MDFLFDKNLTFKVGMVHKKENLFYLPKERSEIFTILFHPLKIPWKQLFFLEG